MRAEVLGLLGHVECANRDFAAAWQQYESTLELFREVGSRGEQAEIIMKQAKRGTHDERPCRRAKAGGTSVADLP